MILKKTKRISSTPDRSHYKSLQVKMNLVHFKFLGAGLHGALNHGVSIALSELD